MTGESERPLLLWNDEKREFTVLGWPAQDTPPFFIDYEGKRYHGLGAFRSQYVFPATEDALLRMVCGIWQISFPPKSEASQEHYPITFTSEEIEKSCRFGETLEEHLYTEPEIVTLKEDRVGVHHNSSYRKFLKNHMTRVLSGLPQRPQSLLEVGAGAGDNLLFLKEAFPDLRVVGLERSNLTEVIRRTASHFHLDIEAVQGDISDPKIFEILPPNSFDVVFLHGVFHVLNGIEQTAFQNIVRLSKKWILIYDPMPELWQLATPRTFASLFYFWSRGYLSGFFKSLADGIPCEAPYKIHEACRLGHSLNPFNETCFTKVEVVKD